MEVNFPYLPNSILSRQSLMPFFFAGSTTDDNLTAASFLSDMYMFDFSNMSEVTSTQLSVGSSSVVSGLAGALALPTFHPGKRANPAFFADTATNGSDTRLWIFGPHPPHCLVRPSKKDC